MKKIVLLLIACPLFFMIGKAQSCDTLFNLRSNLDTATLYAADTAAGAGYISGNNIYGDLIKAEAFAVPDTGYSITSASFYFGSVSISGTDSNTTVQVYVWDNTGTSRTGTSAPGMAIDSAQVTLGQIARAVTENKWLQVFFSTPVLLTTDTIFVGIYLPVDSGDMLALYTNTAPPGGDGNGWEYALNTSGVGYSWGSYNSDWQISGGGLGNYISADICSGSLAPVPSASFAIAGNDSTACSPIVLSFADSTQSTPMPVAWTWSFGDGNISNLQNPSNMYMSGGSYVVTESVTVDTGSVVQVLAPATYSITVISSPSVSATVTPAIDSTNTGAAYIAVTGGSGHYFSTWSTGDLGDSISNVMFGTYTVTIQDQNGCSITDSVIIPMTYGTGIITLSQTQQVFIYPNPTTDLLNLKWTERPNADISILSMQGQVLNQRLSENEMMTVFDLHGLATGSYLLRITDRKTNKQESILFSKF